MRIPSLVLLFAAAVVSAISPSGDRLLVIIDDDAQKAGYSKFLGDLEGRGFGITYETPKSETLELFHLGERSYDHVIFLPTKAKGLGPKLTANILVEFLNADGNILVALSSSQPAATSLVSLLVELDIHLPTDRSGLVVDHFNYDVSSAAEKHDVILVPTQGPLRPDLKDYFSPPSPNGEVIAFPSTIAQTLGNGELLYPILRAPSTSYSYDPKDSGESIEEVQATGKQISLVTGVQVRNSARLTVLGSVDVLSNKWFDAKVKKVGEKSTVATLNREFAKRITGWAFKEIGVVRVNSIEHKLKEAGQPSPLNPKIYRIKNNVNYAVSMSEYEWDHWVPFTVPAADELQLEFSMLSPFHRLPLKPISSANGTTTYSVDFKLPDQHGIFNFLLSYRRPFVSYVEEKRTVSVRHFAHDEWPRSFVISGAWPWIAGIGVTITGWIGFVAIWLYSKPEEKKESKKTR